MEEKSTLHRRFKALIKERGIRQADVARALNIQPANLYTSLNQDVKMSSLVRLANLLDCTVDELIHEPRPRQPLELVFTCPHCGRKSVYALAASPVEGADYLPLSEEEMHQLRPRRYPGVGEQEAVTASDAGADGQLQG